MAQGNSNFLTNRLIKTTKPGRLEKRRYCHSFVRGADKLSGNTYTGPGHAGRKSASSSLVGGAL